MDLHTHDSDLNISPSNRASIILFFCAFVFNWLQGISADLVFIWFFRVLSTVSILLIIVLNAIKLNEWYKTKKSKQ